MEDFKILWLFCWKLSPFKKYVDINIAKEIARFIPRTYFYTFTDCAQISKSGTYIAKRFNSQTELDSYVSKRIHHRMYDYTRKSLLPWYSLNDPLEFDKLYRTRFSLNEDCCSICVMKTYEIAVKTSFGDYYKVPISENQKELFWG